MIITKITTVTTNATIDIEFELLGAGRSTSLLLTTIWNVIEFSWKFDDVTIRV